jgi:hypothetical protein
MITGRARVDARPGQRVDGPLRVAVIGVKPLFPA